MSEQNMKSFSSFGRKGSNGKINPTFVWTEEEDEQANVLLERATSKKSAMKILLDRGWSKRSIQQKLRYEDGREMLDQHFNNYLKQIRSA